MCACETEMRSTETEMRACETEMRSSETEMRACWAPPAAGRVGDLPGVLLRVSATAARLRFLRVVLHPGVILPNAEHRAFGMRATDGSFFTGAGWPNVELMKSPRTRSAAEFPILNSLFTIPRGMVRAGMDVWSKAHDLTAPAARNGIFAGPERRMGRPRRPRQQPDRSACKRTPVGSSSSVPLPATRFPASFPGLRIGTQRTHALPYPHHLACSRFGPNGYCGWHPDAAQAAGRAH